MTTCFPGREAMYRRGDVLIAPIAEAQVPTFVSGLEPMGRDPRDG